jgi:hypothetical protein
MDRIADLVRRLEPEMPPPPPDVLARQRDALFQSMALAETTRTRRPRWHSHTRHKGWYVAFGGVAAAAVVAAILVPGSSPSPRLPAPKSAVLTAVTRALAATGDDIEEVQSTVLGAPFSVTSWVDLSSGACRADTSLNGQPSLTIFLTHGSAVFVDYGLREWWTRTTGGVSCEPLTPQAIEHDVSTGDYTVAGHAVVGGQPSLRLVSTSTTTGSHQVAKLTTLWVNAATYLPIQSASTGHLTERTSFTWLPATTTSRAMLDVKVPAGFQRVAAPPAETQTGG